MTTTMFVTADLKPTTCAADAVAMLRVWRAGPLAHRWEVWSVGVSVWAQRRGAIAPSTVLLPVRLLASGLEPLRLQASNQARLSVSRLALVEPASVV